MKMGVTKKTEDAIQKRNKIIEEMKAAEVDGGTVSDEPRNTQDTKDTLVDKTQGTQDNNNVDNVQSVITQDALPQDAATGDAITQGQPPVTTDTQDTKPVDFAHKYSVLQGKYNAETRRAKEVISEQRQYIEAQTTRLTTLEDKLNQLIASQAQAQAQSTGQSAPTSPPASPSTIDISRYLPQEVIDEWGPEMIKIIATVSNQVARDTAQSIFDNGYADIAPKLQEIDTIKERQNFGERDIFLAKLSRLAPEWEEINATPEFRAWLDEADGLSGVPRLTYAQEAFDTFDADRAAVYFDAYKHEVALANRAVNTQTETRQEPEQPTRKQSGDINMTTRVANVSPSKSSGPNEITTPPPKKRKVEYKDLMAAREALAARTITFEQFDAIRREFISSNTGT